MGRTRIKVVKASEVLRSSDKLGASLSFRPAFPCDCLVSPRKHFHPQFPIQRTIIPSFDGK